jgi:hypothetical protein
MKTNDISEVMNSTRQIESPLYEAVKGEILTPETKKDIVEHDQYMQQFEARALERPCYKDHASRLRILKIHIDPVLKGVEGYRSVLEKTLSGNGDSARGYYAELINAYRSYRAGFKILALDKTAYSESGQKTDIDLYAETPGGKRVIFENKDVKSGITLEKSTIRKMDLFSGDLYDYNGEMIKKDAAVFINRKGISKEALNYGTEKGLHTKENMDGRARERYYQNMASKFDSE